MALNPGHTLSNGHYRILRLLGRGGFGFVYLAQDTLQGEKVAIKELIPALVGDPRMLKRFLIEARATMRLTHKRIVRTHNNFSEDGNHYIVMEYVPGGSLEERLQEHGPLPVDEALRVAAEVCEGLACAHEVGVVHCDLKPHNILFDAEGGAKVADFGIAHVSGKMFTRSWHTRTGSFMGTLHYMSPEQMEGVRDDPRIDVYALGAVLYRMLTGQTYLEFDPQETPRSQFDNMQRILEEQPLPPSTHTQEIPVWLDGVMLQALAKRPEARYADAEAMRVALRQGRPAPAAPIGKERALLPGWFWPVTGAAGVLLVVLVIAIVAVVGGGNGGERAVPRPTEIAVAALTTALALPPTHTPTPTATPKATDAPRSTATATDTPRPTATSTLRPTDTPRPPIATNTPQITATQVPTSIPTLTLPKPGEALTRNKDGMVMVYVPAGDFIMGSNEYSDEQPTHTVYLDAFWIDRTEVTNPQYVRFLNALGGHKGACGGQDCINTKSEDDDSHIRYQGGQYVVESGYEDHPVIEVSWYGAQAYCQWAGARLPTEAEWEKAARGTDGRIYPWGNTFDGSKVNSCDRNCEFDLKDTAANDGYSRTAPVGSYPAGASPYGALDLAGNVWEWVADRYDGGYYANSPASNPKGPNSGNFRVLRGGGWGSDWDYVRAASRNVNNPDYTWGNFGFRCAGGSPGE